MMKSVKSGIIVAVSIWGLAACTTTAEECDPTVELSVFNKAACKMSGSYDTRVEQKEKILIDEKATQRDLNNIYAQIKQQQKVANASKAQKQAQLAKLTKSVNNLTAGLKQKAKGKSGLLKQINDVEQQMKSVNNSSGSDMEKQIEIERLQSKLSNLQQALGL